MEFMFSKCHKLKQIKGISNFNTIKLTNMNYMFQECNELEYLDLPNFNTTNISNNIISQLNEEINKNLKIMNEMNLQKKKDYKVIFMSTDQAIYSSIFFKNPDIFSKLEEELYIEYPNLKNQNISFFIKENEINRTATIEENGIKDGDTILIKSIE